MTTAVYQDTYKLPAGMLALAVHGAFFALLYFGFNWQTEPPAAMSVELWQSLPELAAMPPVKAEEAVPPPSIPEAAIKPDIAMPDKKPAKKVAPRPEVEKPLKKDKQEARHAAIKPAATSRFPVQSDPQKSSGAEQQAAREQAAQEAATGRVEDEYISKIASKIRRNVVRPPDVPDEARAEFSVTVLPGGTVLPPRLLKSSGNAAYDNAVERAILKSQPLPLPADAGMFNRFRELKLVFKPFE